MHTSFDLESTISRRSLLRVFFAVIAFFLALLPCLLVGRYQALGQSSTHVRMKLLSNSTRLERTFVRFGKQGIVSKFRRGNVAARTHIVRWIAERGHGGMFDLVCESLNDRDENVRFLSLAMLHSIGPINLKTQMALLGRVSAEIRDNELRGLVRDLMVAIEQA